MQVDFDCGENPQRGKLAALLPRFANKRAIVAAVGDKQFAAVCAGHARPSIVGCKQEYGMRGRDFAGEAAKLNTGLRVSQNIFLAQK